MDDRESIDACWSMYIVNTAVENELNLISIGMYSSCTCSDAWITFTYIPQS